MGSRAARRGYTLLEVFLVLIITGVLIAAIGSAINIHLRVSEVGRTEVEQAQLARAILGRIAGDLRNAVPHIEPVESAAGTTSDDTASAAASASSALGGTGTDGGAGTGGATSANSSSGGGTSSGSASSGSSGSGTQTLQPLKTLSTLGTLKPQSAGSSSSGTSSGAAGGSSAGKSSSGGSSSTSEESEPTAETTTVKPPGIYGDQYTLQVDVSRIRRPGTFTPLGITGDAPGDVKTVGYEFLAITGASDAAGAPAQGLYRYSIDRAAANFNAGAGSSGNEVRELLAEEVASLEFRYFDGTAWQASWDSSGGTLPTAVEIAITLQAPATAAISSSASLTLPQVYRLTVAIPAAQSSGSSTDASTDASTSSSSETTP